MNKAELFFDAITNVREELVEEAQNYRFRRRIRWEKYAGWAACLAVVVCVGWFGLMFIGGGMGGNGADSGNSSGAAVSGDTAPPVMGEESGGAEIAPGGMAQEIFRATVLEVHESYLLVEPLEGEAVRSSADRITVSTESLENLPELKTDDLVEIAFDGNIMESYPAQLGEVYSVALVEDGRGAFVPGT